MKKLTIFIISASLLGNAVILNSIMAHSQTPELGPIVAGTFLSGLVGVTYLAISALRAISEWQKSRI
jgi:hypothetical protein